MIYYIHREKKEKNKMKQILWSNRLSADELIEDMYGSREAMLDEYSSEEDVDTDLDMLIFEENYMELECLRDMFDVETEGEIIVLAKLGLWDGVRSAYKTVGTTLSNILTSNTDLIEWTYDTDLRAVASHHDGTNYYRYRELKPNLSDRQIANFYEKLQKGLSDKQITYYTRSLIPLVEECFYN